jgi:hypothetical protein
MSAVESGMLKSKIAWVNIIANRCRTRERVTFIHELPIETV